ncbi:hypothetical protein Bhyg_14471, partial [Pseudolycoriella hygida]
MLTVLTSRRKVCLRFLIAKCIAKPTTMQKNKGQSSAALIWVRGSGSILNLDEKFKLFNMSSPSPQQSVKPPSRKQRKASPQPSTSSAFSNGNQSIASTSSAIVDGNQSVASTSIAISKLSLGVPPPQQSVKPPSRKQRKASPEPSTSSAAVKESLVGKRKALPQSGESGGCQAIIRLTDVDVSFLEHDQHDLQKPVDSETNNWRKIQNANSRYDMSTVKLKLRSLLVDGKSLVDDGNENQQQQQP